MSFILVYVNKHKIKSIILKRRINILNKINFQHKIYSGMVLYLFKAENLPAGCPPSDCKDYELKNIFRLVSNPPCSEDFLSHIESGQSYPEYLECAANAVSFFNTYNSAKKIQSKFRKLNKNNQHILEGNIKAGIGIHKTKGTHIDFWVFKDKDIFAEFIGGEKDEEV